MLDELLITSAVSLGILAFVSISVNIFMVCLMRKDVEKPADAVTLIDPTLN